MADFPYSGATKFKSYGAVTASSSATTLTAHSSNHTKGSYVQLTSSTPFDACGLILNLTAGGESYRHYVDVAIGASGSEQVVLENIYVRAILDRELNTCAYYPISIPSGSRLAARSQSEVGTQTVGVAVTIVAGGFSNRTSYSKMKSYMGGSTTTDGKVYQTSGASINTKGPYQELTASVDYQTKEIKLGLYSSSTGVVGYLLDIAIGAVGSEVVVIENLAFSMDNSSAANCFLSDWIPFNVPAGTRISYRAQASDSSSTTYINVALQVLF